MSSIYLYLQPFFSFLHNCLPSNRQSYPSLASLLVSFLSFFPLSSALTNCSLVQHILSSSFSASLLFAPNISLPRPRPALLHSSSFLPTHLLYSSPHPDLKSVQLIHYFPFHCPRLATIQPYRPHQCPDHPFLQIPLQTFRQKFL